MDDQPITHELVNACTGGDEHLPTCGGTCEQIPAFPTTPDPLEAKPTIHELEKILEEDPKGVHITPSGEVVDGPTPLPDNFHVKETTKPDEPLDKLARLKAAVEKVEKLRPDLESSEAILRDLINIAVADHERAFEAMVQRFLPQHWHNEARSAYLRALKPKEQQDG